MNLKYLRKKMMEPLPGDAGYLGLVNPQTVLALIDALEEAMNALKWYSDWDWSDKYVQRIDRRAIRALASIEEILGTHFVALSASSKKPPEDML